MIFLYFSFVSYASLNSGESTSAHFSFVHGFSGINFANSFISEKGIHITLHTSLTAALAAKVPNVHICATLSSQYFLLQYSTTLSLSSSAKSVSISGIEILAGFKNLSKSRSYFIGSRSVIHDKNAIRDQAADHLHGQTGTPFCLAQFI
jgi:hypothetical protein